MMPSLKIDRLPMAEPLGGIEAFNVLRGHVDPADPYSEVNLCDYVGDDPLHVVQCRLQLCKQLHIDPQCLVMPRQRHTSQVRLVDARLLALSSHERASELDGVDALVTCLTGVCLGVNTADCVNIALCDPAAGVVAVAHAGWRGTVARIASRTVAAMQAVGAQPGRIVATMGACICQDCFEVGDEVVEALTGAGYDERYVAVRNTRTGKMHVGLPTANKIDLVEAGVHPRHITWNGECTRCNPNLYFSARRLGIASGRTFTGIIRRH